MQFQQDQRNIRFNKIQLCTFKYSMNLFYSMNTEINHYHTRIILQELEI